MRGHEQILLPELGHSSHTFNKGISREIAGTINTCHRATNDRAFPESTVPRSEPANHHRIHIASFRTILQQSNAVESKSGGSNAKFPQNQKYSSYNQVKRPPSGAHCVDKMRLNQMKSQ